MKTDQFLQGTKYWWQLPVYDEQLVLQLSADYNLSIPVVHTLVNRGFTDKKQIDDFLFTSFESSVADPTLIKDAQKAVDRIIRAIEQGEKILIFGDYDVDGITSSALMMLCLLPLGAQVNFFLPHRVRDGYGLSTKIVERAAQNGYGLLITVDNGITAFEPAAKAKELDIDLIITDHHRPHDHLPQAYAIVNPHQHDCEYPFKYFAGVGVSFKILSLLYAKKGLSLPAKAYELLLLGTVADVVPLIGENRFWVRYGLQQVNLMESNALKVLKTNGKVTKPKMSSTDVGFSITPQINALGRLEDPRQGVKFLIGTDEKETESVGKILLELNETRKGIERAIVHEIENMVAAGSIDISKENIVIAAQKNWPSGVIGLVASRIVGLYGRPTILLHLTENGLAKGSCRSITSFNMFNALHEVKDLLLQFGGHAQAAGLSLKAENIPLLKERLEQLIAQQLTPFDLQQKIMIDATARLTDLTKKCMDDLEYLEPFGNQNSYPIFHIKQVTLVQKPTLLKDAHVKAMIFADGVIKPIIFFNRPELFQLLCDRQQEFFDIVATVNENHWNGRVSIELTGLDVAYQPDNN